MATVTRENIGLLNDKITVKVQQEDYLPSFEKALKNYSKSANLPGFRKGMVPVGMIKKMHGQAVFTDEVLRTVEKELSNYMVNEKLEIFAQPLPMSENDPRQIDMNKPAEYAFSFEVGLKPEFTLPELSKEKVTRYKVTVTDEMVNEEVERQLVRYGNMTEPETVESEENVLNITFIETDAAGHEVEGGIRKDNSLLVKYFAESFRPSLMGKKKDDIIELQLNKAFDEKEREWVIGDLGLSKEDPAAAEKYFKALITKVGLVEKADMNEEFFKAAYPGKEIKTEEEFRETLRNDIQAYWDTQSRNHLQHELYHVLVEHTKIDFPDTFLKRWMQNGGEQPKTTEQVENEFPSFLNQLKWTLVIDKIVQENQIEVSPDELVDFAKKQLFGYMGMQAGAEEQPWVNDYVQRMMQDRKYTEDAYHRIQTEKVFAWAEETATPTEKAVSLEEFSELTKEHEHHHHH